MKHFDYIQELDGPQSYVAPGGRTILCKGGGGGSSQAYYGNMDQLYGVQSQAAQYMLDNSMPYIPGYMENSNKMVSETMDGTLSTQMRQRAGNESTATMGAALAASDRNMQRYGMGFSADRLLTESNRNAIMGAAGKAGAINTASAAAEDMKWNRNAGGLAQATGMGMGATESVGSAARGYGAAAGQVNQYDALNSAGYGKFGAAVASNAFKDGGSVKSKPGLDSAPRFNVGGEVSDFVNQMQPGGFVGGMADKAYAAAEKARPGGTLGHIHDELRPGGTVGNVFDNSMPGRKNYLNSHANGGTIRSDKKPGLHLATGGAAGTANPWSAWKNNNPIQTSNTQSDSGGGLGDTLSSVAIGASPILIGKGMKAGLSAVKGAMTPAAPAAVAPTSAAGSGLTTGTVEAGGAMANGTEGVAAAKAAADSATAANAANAATTTGSGLTTGTAGLEAGGVMATGAETGVAAAGADLAGTAGVGAAIDAGAGGGAALGALTADGAAAAGTAAAGEMATAAGASATMGPVGWVAAGALALGALGMSQGWFADGGDVDRKDFTPGGDVKGPGTETSDDIPAWLSDGEHVQNAVSSKLAGLDTLNKINDEGLKVRKGKQTEEAAKVNIGRAMIQRGKELSGGLGDAKGNKHGVKLASGGNVGIALGAAADEWNKQRVIGMEQSLVDLKLKEAQPRLNTLKEQEEAYRDTYSLQSANSKAGLSTLPQQTANTKMQQQATGIGLNNVLLGHAGKSLQNNDKGKTIDILNQAAAAQPGFNGTTIVDVTPQKDGAGVYLHMSDESVKPVSRDEIVGAMGSIKQGEYQFIHDSVGNVYTGNKTTGAVTQQIKGDPAQFNNQHSPVQTRLADDWVASGFAKDRKDAFAKMNNVKGKSEAGYVLDYVAKSAGMGQPEELAEAARKIYRSVNGATTQPKPANSGTNWQEYAAPAQ